MKIHCNNCDQTVEVNGIGRKPLNIPLKIVCESLQIHRDVEAAASELGCSQGYIFKALKANRLKLGDVIKKQNGKGGVSHDKIGTRTIALILRIVPLLLPSRQHLQL